MMVGAGFGGEMGQVRIQNGRFLFSDLSWVWSGTRISEVRIIPSIFDLKNDKFFATVSRMIILYLLARFTCMIVGTQSKVHQCMPYTPVSISRSNSYSLSLTCFDMTACLLYINHDPWSNLGWPCLFASFCELTLSNPTVLPSLESAATGKGKGKMVKGEDGRPASRWPGVFGEMFAFPACCWKEGYMCFLCLDIVLLCFACCLLVCVSSCLMCFFFFAVISCKTHNIKLRYLRRQLQKPSK